MKGACGKVKGVNESERRILLHARWVLPITRPPIRDGIVFVKGDQIVGVGEFKEFSRETAEVRMEFPDGILVPGFANPHTHLENTHFAGKIKYPQSFNKWLLRMVQLVRSQSFDEAVAAARDGVKQLVKSGVTCVGEFSRLGASAVALREAGLRGVVFKEFICLTNRELKTREQELVNWLDTCEFVREGLLRVGLGPHAPYTVTPKALGRVFHLAFERNLQVCIHAAESPFERKLFEDRRGAWNLLFGPVVRDVPVGISPIRHLDQMGILNQRTLAVHCVQVDETDISLLAQRGTWVVHCPRSNANLRVGTMPLARMLSEGVKVCLATDGLASVDSLSPLDEIRFAIKLGRKSSGLYPHLSPEDWLRMVTIRAAEALGFGSKVGSLEVGKQADIAVFQFSSPVNDPFEALIGEARDAALTMIAGRVVWSNQP